MTITEPAIYKIEPGKIIRIRKKLGNAAAHVAKALDNEAYIIRIDRHSADHRDGSRHIIFRLFKDLPEEPQGRDCRLHNAAAGHHPSCMRKSSFGFGITGCGLEYLSAVERRQIKANSVGCYIFNGFPR